MSDTPDYPFDRLQLSPAAEKILRRFWFQVSQRRPFKWDFPKMHTEAPEEFDEMFEDIASTVDEVIAAKGSHP